MSGQEPGNENGRQSAPEEGVRTKHEGGPSETPADDMKPLRMIILRLDLLRTNFHVTEVRGQVERSFRLQ